ncbi:PTS sugar transporter subunit IIA [Kiritimatiellaeota bacterium B1221]|nr:PTS sugar transporter subunit IIA [Kiritimatiellaeota bacterium B1221]
MNIRKVIPKESVCVSLQARDKQGIIEELLELIVRTGRVSDRKAVLKAVLDREKKMSTGMHHGLAIPHGKTDTVDTLLGAVGILPEGVDFDSQDGEPTRIFILTVSPVNRSGPHIQFLAEISRMMNRQDIREALLATASEDEIYTILTGQ